MERSMCGWLYLLCFFITVPASLEFLRKQMIMGKIIMVHGGITSKWSYLPDTHRSFRCSTVDHDPTHFSTLAQIY